ncbi:hypothetical protein ACYFX5_14110 [Bremerella sp. T1]|uniref:hypothetical protein n=1 Tax=Bremerella sp. TYQ1 TaxID=3119568 RepID=UPI001CCBAF37|nr:hypothetical protein [Bremerella volcania]UBM34192.1 hypothetical protein LA756_16050 [Bremerella volcania]
MQAEQTGESGKPKRTWRVRWSLRVLIGMVTLACVLLGWGAYRIRVGQLHEEVGRELVMLGRSSPVLYSKHHPSLFIVWQYEVTEPQKLPISFRNGLTYATPSIIYVKVKGTPSWMEWTGTSLMFQRIKSISHRDALPGDEFQEIIDQITRLDQVESIEFGSSINLQQLTQDDLAAILSHVRVQQLWAPRCKLKPGPIPQLRGSGLRSLDLSHTWFSDEAAADLPTTLTDLNLTRTAITDDGLTELRRLKNLKFLRLDRTPTSERAIDQLRQDLPNCEVAWEPLVQSDKDNH